MSFKNYPWRKHYAFTEDYDLSFYEEIKNSSPELKSDSKVKVFRTKKIITMNPVQPFADSAAVLNGKIFKN
jgi:hypothetical protein